MLPYGRQSVSEADIAAVTDVLRGDWLTTGPAVRQFEAELSGWAGGATCVSVTSGTAALHTAYAAARLGPGDEVVTSPMTFVATASTAAQLGATVVFADVEPDTGLLDPDAAKAAVTERTRVVSAIDYAGHPADYDALRPVADAAGALLLDDAAHSIGGTYHGRPIGSIADLTTFSFFPTKNLTTAEGGAVATTRPELAERAARFRTIGLVREPDRLRFGDEGGWHQEVHEFGLNYRLPDVLCALGIAQLRRLGAFVARRAELVDRYRRLLSDVDGLALPVQRPDVAPAWHLFSVRVLGGRRREIYDGMRAAGIGVQVNYLPVYWHPVFADLGYRRGLCPVAEEYYSQQLSLPLFPDLTDEEQDRVVEVLRSLLG
ncbi:MAG: aminotransferase class V-fold PLP-dependent enzyme [Actinocatenispora sp.]